MSDLNGCWVCKGTENMEKLLEALGIGWVMRKTFSGLGYGVGKQQYRISGGEPGSLEIMIVNKDPMGNEKTLTLKTDGTEVLVDDGPFGKGMTKATWDGNTLVQVVNRNDGTVLERKWAVVGDVLEVTMIFKGVTGKRTYTKN